MKIRRARAERFGAIVATEEPAALVSIDRALARRIGIDGGPLWEGRDEREPGVALEGPTEVHLAVTDRCPASCTGCYADARADGHAPSFEELAARLRTIAELGTFSVALGGGEALTRDDLPELAELARSLGMVPTMTTSGIGMTPELARRLGAFAQVNVSHDGPDGAYRDVRGFDGSRLAERATAMLRDAGVAFGVNVVLTRATFDRLAATAQMAESLGAVELQIVRFKPSGRGRLDYLARRCTPAQVDAFPRLLRAISEARSIGIRIDCAMIPFLAADPEVRAADLARFGVIGCEAGRSLMTIGADGGVAGCSFAPGDRDPVSVRSWEDDRGLDSFRARHAALGAPCASCDLRSSCRGGCRVVATHLGDPGSPDPECPRVRAARA